MKAATDYLWFETREHREFINITEHSQNSKGNTKCDNLSHGMVQSSQAGQYK